jgi:hypothetical protein
MAILTAEWRDLTTGPLEQWIEIGLMGQVNPYWRACRTGGRPKTDPAKLENARILYENSDKTAAEVCEIAGVGRRTF